MATLVRVSDEEPAVHVARFVAETAWSDGGAEVMSISNVISIYSTDEELALSKRYLIHPQIWLDCLASLWLSLC